MQLTELTVSDRGARSVLMLCAVVIATTIPNVAGAEAPPRLLTWMSGKLVAHERIVSKDVATVVGLINEGKLDQALKQAGRLSASEAVRGALAAAVAGHIGNARPDKAIKATEGHLRRAVEQDDQDVAARRLLHEIDFFTCGLPSKGFMAMPNLLPSRDRIYGGNFESGRGHIRTSKPKMTVFGLWCLSGILESQPKYAGEYEMLLDDLGTAIDDWEKHLAKHKARDRRLEAFRRIHGRVREHAWAKIVIPTDSPLYPQALIEHVRTYYWWWRQQGERYRPMSKQGFLELLVDLKAGWPDLPLTQMYDGKKIPWGSEFLPDSILPGTPLWAVRQQELRGRVDHIVEWWWKHRQAPNGSMGGGWDDDCEVLRRWSITSIICGNSKIEAGIRKLVNGIWTSRALLEDTGYFRRRWDVEHSCETTSDSSVILALDYGDPLQIERFLKTTLTTDTVHTAVNAHGHRHFIDINMGGKFIPDREGDGVDTLYHGRAMRPAALIAWYTSIPRAVKLQHEYALARSEDTVRPGRDGKPAGVMPACIRFKDEHVDGPNNDSWICKSYGDLYGWGDSHNRDMILGKLLNAWLLTGDDRVLDGYRAELKLIQKYMNRENSDASEASEEWAARTLSKYPKFATWYRVVTGDRQFDDIVEKDADYGRYLVSGDPAAIVAAHEADLSYVRYNVPMVTSEVRGTDRVDLHPWSLLPAMTGSSISITEPPMFHVTWRNVDRNFAALVRNDFGAEGGTIWIYKFGRRSAKPDIRFWRLDPGMYEVAVFEDLDHDGDPDGPALQTQEIEVRRRMDGARLAIPGQKVCLVRVRQLRGLPALPERMADLAVAPRDLAVESESLLVGQEVKGSLVIHNVGAMDANGVRVRFGTTSGEAFGVKVFSEMTLDGLAHPADFVPKTAKVDFSWTPRASGKYRLRAEVMTADGAPEIYLGNNVAELNVVVDGGTFASRSSETRPKKKLLQYGYGVPRPEFLRDHIDRMELRPFDGVIFRLKTYGNIFDTKPWDRAELEKQTKILAQVRWKKFTDNFLCLYAASRQGMDWFDDEHWKAITGNLTLAARAAKAARAKGVCFDAEPYGPNPWRYPGRDTDKSFAEVTEKVRQRGAQFMEALQAEMPDAHVMTLFLISHWREGRSRHLSLLDEPDRERRVRQLSKGYYAVFPAFLNGMLSVAGPRIRFTDGNESPSYYMKDSAAAFRDYHRMRNSALSLIDEENHDRYRAQVQVGMAIYMDYLLGVRTRVPNLGIYLSPEDRLRWLEHNIYWSLTAADEYVWVYHEFMDWWGTIPKTYPHGHWMVPGAPVAIESARRKVRDGLPLGFDTKKFIANALSRNRKRYPSPVNEGFRPAGE